MSTSSDTMTYPLAIQNFGRARMSDLFEDWVIYRNLEPLDRRLRGLKSAHFQMGLLEQDIPRKLDKDYAKAAFWFLEQIQDIRGVTRPLQEFLVIGDTVSGDVQSFRNVCDISGWIGTCFIGNEKSDEAASYSVDEETGIYTANRWTSIGDWLAWTLDRGLVLDEATAVVVDMDKTAYGARGRNHRAIDAARLGGLYRTMASVLGDRFDPDTFEETYNTFNRSRYHGLTEDNQDYLAYICLILNAEVVTCEQFEEQMEAENLRSFNQFIRWVDTRISSGQRLREAIRQIHEAVLTSVRTGDPTPFKAFRRQEYLTTLEHMGNLADNVPAAQRLADEITITQEVREAALWLQKRGCLVMSMSDKPAEASQRHRSMPDDLPPIHRAETHCTGISIQEALNRLG